MRAQRFRNIVDDSLASQYYANGWWNNDTVDQIVVDRAVDASDGIAYATPDGTCSWADVARSVDVLASSLVELGVEPGARIAVYMPDIPVLHIAFLAIERVGATIVGVGARAGHRELGHLLERTGATMLLTRPLVSGSNAERTVAGLLDADTQGAVARSSTVGSAQRLRHVVIDGDDLGLELAVFVDGGQLESQALGAAWFADRRIGPDDLYLLNSTSGTTGLPKCVVHTQNRWTYFHHAAVRNGALTNDDVFLAIVPAPFGFGLWTSHITPLRLGSPTVVLERFSPELAFEMIHRHKVSVLACVSTQFIMMLASHHANEFDLSSLRVTFTGGEAVPFEKARHFEELTGCTILQFYGSNETGELSGTTLEDSAPVRLHSAGRIDPNMSVRLFDNGVEVPIPGRGQPACLGPALSQGYLDDPVGNRDLYTDDGWMLMGDICEIDANGILRVVGRTSDLIIRGGKNISASQVEADVMTHPSVAHAAAVSMPDPVFGERVCVYIEVVEGEPDPDLEELIRHLGAGGVSKELFPERLIVLDALPRSSGAKVAKGELRQDIRRRLEEESLVETGALQ